MNELTAIQKEIVTALEQLKEKSLITEAVLAKKVRENTKAQVDRMYIITSLMYSLVDPRLNPI